ncbi:hypothetical protein C8J56DRAFT_918849 [Mycena floridula]|nr:hypothetical protein C8J56DRAFT_918849 [Mycena floridula]
MAAVDARVKAPSVLPGADSLRLRVKKRIVVLCDGTWQDGISTADRQSYTNILRLARTIDHEDKRDSGGPPIPQIVFYQSGIGSEKNFYAEYIEGTTGASLGDKVEEAYAFIAHNYFPGDEIFLFGFSRGAYTARMVAMFIGAIGVLDRTNMDQFASLFKAYQLLGKNTDDEAESARLKAQLEPFTRHDSPGKLRADSNEHSFSVKCVGVFDTVGSLGLPEELTVHSTKIRTLFGFPDKLLGEHIERAYQALALNETRKDFNCAKFELTPGGRAKKQILEQCWFTGCHSDIGGGYFHHDLADLTLTWMIAHVQDILSMDLQYLARLPKPVAPWGSQKPHDPTKGIFSLATTIQRQLPTTPNDGVTNETIHPSVLHQAQLYPDVRRHLDEHPTIIGSLLALEEEIKEKWTTFRRTATIPEIQPEKKAGLVSEFLHRVSGNDN